MSPGHLDRDTLSQQIAAYYAEKIRGGQIAPGDKLPSVAQLCDIWHVAWATAGKATKILADAGLVQTSRRGTYASEAE